MLGTALLMCDSLGQLSDSSLIDPPHQIRNPSPLLRSVAEHSARACHQITSIREMQEYS
jgi:hypothetical protein